MTVFQAFELDLARLFLFGVVDFFPTVSNVAWVDRIDGEKLQSPDDIGGVLNVAGFFETLKRNRLRVISAIETADDYKSRIGVTLKFFKLANGVVDAKFR